MTSLLDIDTVFIDVAHNSSPESDSENLYILISQQRINLKRLNGRDNRMIIKRSLKFPKDDRMQLTSEEGPTIWDCNYQNESCIIGR